MSTPVPAPIQRLLVDAAQSVLGELTWEGEPGLTDLTAFARYQGEEGDWVVVADAFSDQPLLLVYSIAPDVVPVMRLPDVIEFITRANNGLPRANLEIDLDERIVRCRTSLDVEGLDVAALAEAGFLAPLVRRIVLANVATLDLFLPGLRAVIAGTMTPEQADDSVDDDD